MRNTLFRQAGRALAAMAVLLALQPPLSLAESRVEITPFVGYTVGGGFVTPEGELNIDPSASFGGTLGYRAAPDLLVELAFSRQSSTIQYESGSFEPHEDLFDLTVQHVNVGAVYEHGFGGIHPFFGGGLGITRFEPDLADTESETRFSFNFSTGVRGDLSSRLGLRAGVRGWFTSPPDDGEPIFESEVTDDYIQSGVSLIDQYEFTVGLVFGL